METCRNASPATGGYSGMSLDIKKKGHNNYSSIKKRSDNQ